MELKLNIYKPNEETGELEVSRVLTNNSAFIPHKVFRKVLKLVDADNLPDDMTKAALLGLVAKIAVTSMDELTNILVLTFAKDRLTEEELDYCDTAEMCAVIVEMLVNSFRTKFENLFNSK